MLTFWKSSGCFFFMSTVIIQGTLYHTIRCNKSLEKSSFWHYTKLFIGSYNCHKLSNCPFQMRNCLTSTSLVSCYMNYANSRLQPGFFFFFSFVRYFCFTTHTDTQVQELSKNYLEVGVGGYYMKCSIEFTSYEKQNVV